MQESPGRHRKALRMDADTIQGGTGERSFVKRHRVGFLLLSVVLALVSSAVIRTAPRFEPTGSKTAPVSWPPAEGFVTLVAVGDVIIHSPMLTAAWEPRLRIYDYRPMFRHVKPDLQGADMAVAVLETVLGAGIAEYSGYPRFNSPDAVAEALQWAGVDLVFTAHNHMLDHGTEALFRTVSQLDRIGMGHAGSAKSDAAKARVALMEANGVKVAFLSYTTITNGFSVPASMPWAVNLYSQRAMADDVAAARDAGADFVIAALHAGVEYQRIPDASQRKIADQMVDAGVDIILGSHPHAVQPYEIRRVARPDGSEKEAYIFYSLGNFVSNQMWRFSDCGLMVWLSLAKLPGEPPKVSGMHWHPVWVHCYRPNGSDRRYRVLPIDERGAAAYAEDDSLTEANRQRIQQVWDETMELLEKSASSQP